MKENQQKILDEMYNIREGEVEKNYIIRYGELEEKKEVEKAYNELIEFIEKFIIKEDDKKELSTRVNNFQINFMNELCFWYKPYYKMGFIDAMSIIADTRKENLFNDTQK